MAIRIINSLLIVACLIVAFALVRQQPAQVLVTAAATVPVGHDQPNLEPNAAELAMRRRLPAIAISDITLPGALNELSKAAEFRIETRLENWDFRRDVRVSLNVIQDTTLREALQDLFEQINAHMYQSETLAAETTEDLIIVAPQEVLDGQATTVVYNVRDLLDADAQNANKWAAVGDVRTPAQRLIKLISDVQFGDLMPVRGGASRDVILPWQHDFMGLIIVRGSRRQHAKIAELLQNLREASRERAPSSRIVKEPDTVQ